MSGNNATKYLRLIVENVDVLIKGWYKVPYQITIPCVCHRCASGILPPLKRHNFTYQECEKAASQGKGTLTCTMNETIKNEVPVEYQDDFEVRLDSLAPDLMMLDMIQLKIKFEDIDLGEVIGKGGFGEVYKGTFKGDIVAVKKLITDGLSPNDVTEVFREFRREVWLSR